MSAPEQDRLAGSGAVTCECGNHRNRCHFGRPHGWSTPWYDDSGVLRQTDKCMECGSVCAAEAERLRAPKLAVKPWQHRKVDDWWCVYASNGSLLAKFVLEGDCLNYIAMAHRGVHPQHCSTCAARLTTGGAE